MLFYYFLYHAGAQNTASSKTKTTEHFDAYIQNAMQLWKTPGLAVVVVKNGHVVFNKAYGEKIYKHMRHLQHQRFLFAPQQQRP